jgi:hypothetical protein
LKLGDQEVGTTVNHPPLVDKGWILATSTEDTSSSLAVGIVLWMSLSD